MRWVLLASCALGVALVTGCGTKGPPRKPTFRVTGKLTVDGETPKSPVQIECQSVAGLDEKMPTFSRTDSNPDGSFEIATYQKGDGVPPGEYVLVLSSRDLNLMTRDYTGPDKLKNRYSDAKKSDIKFTVKDKPVDLGEVKLTTK